MLWGEGHVSVFGDIGRVGGNGAKCSCTLVFNNNNANPDVRYEEVLENLFHFTNLV